MSGPQALRPFLEARSAMVERASLRSHGGPGSDACAALSDHLDDALRDLAAAAPATGVALVAVGGYGRREQCRHSDVDLMLLFEDTPPRPTVDAILYPLWDAGLKVGHSVRTLRDVTPAARDNVETFTSLLDARLLAGDEALFERFEEARDRLLRRRAGWLRDELAARHAARVSAEPWQLQETDVKEGRGGLRELHSARWLDVADAAREGRDPPPLEPALAGARETLLATRNALHALDDRANDRFRRDLAGRAAELLGSSRIDWSRRLTRAMREVDRALAARLEGGRPRRWWSRWRRAGPAGSRELHSAATPMERLMDALRSAAPGPLDPLSRADWLDTVLPEWEVLRAQPHIAPFHLHPVDVHVWRTVAELRAAVIEDLDDTGTPQAAADVEEHELLLAALLHDIGKGHAGDHSEAGALIAERFCARAGHDDDVIRRISTAVRRHLLLPNVATRRDIADPRVIAEVAGLLGDTRTLDLTYVLSVADARASGPDVWSAWKAQLMRALYVRVRGQLSDVPLESAVEQRRREVIAALSGRYPAEAVRAHLEGLPPGYALAVDTEAIGRHLQLIAEAAGGVAMDHDRHGEVDRLTIVLPDRPGLLQAISGTLAVHNVVVLNGVAYTRDDGVAIEVMHVGDALGHEIDDRRWERVLDAVPRALGGEFPIDERLAQTRAAYPAAPQAPFPTTVLVDNEGSERYSIVEVRAADRLGLLYAITSAMHELALDIHLAKVDTLGGEVVDAFYVLRENGRRVEEPDEIERLVARIEQAIAALEAL